MPATPSVQSPGQPSVRPPAGILNRMRGSISRVRIEGVVSRATGIFGFAFALQSLPSVIDSGTYLKPAWALALPIVLFGCLLAVVVTSIVGRGVAIATGVMALVFVLALVLWPAAVLYPDAVAGTQPWLWYLMVIGMSCAAVSFSVWLAAFYIGILPFIYAVVRTLPSGGEASVALASLDAFYVFILGAFALILVTSLRQAADRVDRAQGAAMLRYSVAVKQDALETERVHVDALVHDRVLTTLLTAARSSTAMERDLVVTMAEGALDALRSSGDGGNPGFEVELADLADRLSDAARVLSSSIGFARETVPQRAIPGDVAEAVFSAAVQAMVNSLQHAGVQAGAGEPLRIVSLHAMHGRGFTVQVSDTGVGFDPGTVPQERLGLRVSICERVAAVGGVVHVQSVPEAGTSIMIVWPA
ncbi:sensor histidine kinase [Agreia sp. COWG]|uniref:sensor histidine kinase n=1 Tax=Agreia sp. COWG TaxID=2773266 RepID=UPI0019288A5B|nr:ATP-binding protein [Agreia sp. COWG]